MCARRQLRLHRSAALILLALAGCSYAVVSDGRINLRQSARIYSDVQELRQLNFEANVPLVLMDQAQANLVMERDIAREHDAVELQRAAQVGVLTGLYAPGIDLKAQTMRALRSQVVAFYDPVDRKMILVKGKSTSGWWSEIAGFFAHKDASGEMLVAHELTHALQDQYFGVHAAVARITDNDDRRLALRSVVEGDATLVGYGFISGFIDNETVATMLTHLQDMPRLFDVESPGTPEALRDALIFQYTDGTRFVGEIYLRGGWSAVNALYRNPPLSTREILDPALYFSHAAPLTITLGGWTAALSGWHKVAENTYGELLLHVILTRSASGEAQASLARAWRGDRMAVLQSGRAITVIWIVLLSEDTKAAAFAQAYQGILERVAAGGATPAHHVERRGSAVLAIIGPGAAQWAELAPAVWRASRIGVSSPGA